MKLLKAFIVVQSVHSSTPNSWNNYSSEQRIDLLEGSVSTLFDEHFGTKTKLQNHFNDVIDDMRKIEDSCQPTGRRRRSASKIAF